MAIYFRVDAKSVAAAVQKRILEWTRDLRRPENAFWGELGGGGVAVRWRWWGGGDGEAAVGWRDVG